ncbi:MAG: SUMF1/EgtB/PvdO family nonheme iron enzyme [Bacteroidales bacterium]|nr:SUMF1/EgtB/PvdO family nonheme iron enzyme [Bacteroidales bacterium]
MLKAFFILTFISYELIVTVQNKPAIEWVTIPAGTFNVGSPACEAERDDNETMHQVNLSAFMMSRYEVTCEKYDLFSDATGRKKHPGIIVNRKDATSGKTHVRRGGSWNDCVKCCRSAYRDNVTPEYGDYSIGIRLVKSF